MNSKEKIVLQKLQDYFLIKEEIDRLYSTLLENGDFEGSVTSKITPDGGCRTNAISSKVESNSLRKIELEERINKLSNELYQIDEACKYINKEETKIIDYVKKGTKLSEIARTIKVERKRVETIRNRAVKKIAEKVKF